MSWPGDDTHHRNATPTGVVDRPSTEDRGSSRHSPHEAADREAVMFRTRSDALRTRAEHLRREAFCVPELLAVAYRRRACELELLAAVIDPPVAVADARHAA
jgi:hypothetical protein